jgi:hypothetical protein
MRLGGGDVQVHHHGPFAGLGVATAGVILAGVGLWALWHRIAGPLGEAFLIAMWIVLMSGCAIAVAGAGWVWVLLIGHTRRTLRATAPPPVTMTAQAIPVATIPAHAIPAPTAAELPPPPAAVAAIEAAEQNGQHFHFHGAEAVEAAMRALGHQDTR